MWTNPLGNAAHPDAGPLLSAWLELVAEGLHRPDLRPQVGAGALNLTLPGRQLLVVTPFHGRTWTAQVLTLPGSPDADAFVAVAVLDLQLPAVCGPPAALTAAIDDLVRRRPWTGSSPALPCPGRRKLR